MKLDRTTMGIVLGGLGLLLIILLGLVKVDFDSQAVFLCDIVHADPDLEMSECPAHKSNVPWLLMVGFGISFLIFGAGMYLIFSNRIEKKSFQKEFAAIDTSKLNEEESKIYNLLKEREGSMYQSDLIKETGFSKVKTTRILDKLEHDDRVLERKRRGMTNIVVLK